jgi:hypothetical protein
LVRKEGRKERRAEGQEGEKRKEYKLKPQGGTSTLPSQ